MAKEMVKIKATAMWAFLSKPNTYNPDRPKYQVDLTNLSAEDVKKLESIGVTVKRDEKKPEKGFFITPKSNYVIKAYDKAGNEVHDVVGNGTKVEAVVYMYTTQFKNKTFHNAAIAKLVITELVTYAPAVVVDEEETL